MVQPRLRPRSLQMPKCDEVALCWQRQGATHPNWEVDNGSMQIMFDFFSSASAVESWSLSLLATLSSWRSVLYLVQISLLVGDMAQIVQFCVRYLNNYFNIGGSRAYFRMFDWNEEELACLKTTVKDLHYIYLLKWDI